MIECLYKAYISVHGKEPAGLADWEIAKAILEVLDAPEWLSNELARECIYQIVQVVEYPDDEVRIRIVAQAEESARDIFPELKNVSGGIHMDLIGYLHDKERGNYI